MKKLIRVLWGLIRLLLWVYMAWVVLSHEISLTRIANALEDLEKWALDMRSKGY